jgi:predicted dehydrogenase
MVKQKIKVGVIGCGNISGIYFKNMKKSEILDVMACADIVESSAISKAKEYNIPKVCSVKELLSDKEIKIVVNLTPPNAHAEVALASLEAGKSVYNEKPLAVRLEDAQKMIKLAKSKKVLLGCAPDTFFGGGQQTCRKIIDDGIIGEPVAATAFMLCHGHESWHPNPEFYYQIGGGPMFDMGPYYITALINLIGPIRRVTSSARITFPERLITSLPKRGTIIKVKTPTHIAGVFDFENGAIGTIITSFDVWATGLPRIEVYGTKGSLSVPDPNCFGGPVKVKLPQKDWVALGKGLKCKISEWYDVPLTHGYTDNSRGIGVADMAYSLLSGKPHRASGELAYHVLEIMHAFLDASKRGKHIILKSTCERPSPLPTKFLV